MSSRQPPPQQQALAPRGQQSGLTRRESEGKLTRISDNTATRELVTFDPSEAVAWIEEASTKGHIVTPSMTPVLPHGRGVAVSIVRVTDFGSQGTQLYPIPGSSNLGLHKNVLDEIGRGYGIDWPPDWTKREPFTIPGQAEDPRDKDPYCIKITVCGRYKRFDGTWATLPALTKEIDLREGSAEVEQIRTRQREKALEGLPPNASPEQRDRAVAVGKAKADAEIAQLRKFIRAHAQTKARLQVIGTLVRRSYSAAELQKPFYVFSSVWTGRSNDPEIDMMLAQGALKMEMDSRNLLYGVTAATPQLPEVSPEPYQADAEIVAYEEAMSTAEQPQPETAEATPPEGPKQCTPDECLGKGSNHVKACFATVTEPTGTSTEEEWVVPSGRFKDKKLSELNKSELSSLLEFYDLTLDEGSLSEEMRAQYKDYRDRVLAAGERRGFFGGGPM